jgi:hypothetical protein
LVKACDNSVLALSLILTAIEPAPLLFYKKPKTIKRTTGIKREKKRPVRFRVYILNEATVSAQKALNLAFFFILISYLLTGKVDKDVL